MVTKKVKCKFGKLKQKVRSPSGSMRTCKLPGSKRSTAAISSDRKRKSSQKHEIKYRKDKRKTAKKTTKRKTTRKKKKR